ncbi:MAG: hypothetical protein ACXVCY_11385 [Pseudobdellovibrionaceae bacterium]
MKANYILLIIALLLSLKSKALDPYKSQGAIEDWLHLSNQFSTTSDQPIFLSTAENEKQFLANFDQIKETLIKKHFYPSTHDSLSHEFMSAAIRAYEGCTGVRELIDQIDSDINEEINEKLYSVWVIAVGFNLCEKSDLALCDFNSSLGAKNFPDKNLILVNAIKWNTMPELERPSFALHEYGGIFGFERGNYQVTSKFSFKKTRHLITPYQVQEVTSCETQY